MSEESTHNIFFIASKCRGCLRCELACSFHHSDSKYFQPSISSTRILRNNNNKEITMFIDSSCDFCRNEKIPFCVHACPFGARGVVNERR